MRSNKNRVGRGRPDSKGSRTQPRTAIKCEEAANLAALGYSDRYIAKELHCSRTTVKGFRKTEEFQNALRGNRKAARGAFREALTGPMLGKAVQYIDRVLSHKKPNPSCARLAVVLLASAGLIRKAAAKQLKAPHTGKIRVKWKTPPSEIDSAKAAALPLRAGNSNTQ